MTSLLRIGAFSSSNADLPSSGAIHSAMSSSTTGGWTFSPPTSIKSCSSVDDSGRSFGDVVGTARRGKKRIERMREAEPTDKAVIA